MRTIKIFTNPYLRLEDGEGLRTVGAGSVTLQIARLDDLSGRGDGVDGAMIDQQS